jgi:hypothetical protein
MRKMLLALLLIAAGAGALFFLRSPNRGPLAEMPRPDSRSEASTKPSGDSSSQNVFSSSASSLTQQVNAILAAESPPPAAFVAPAIVTTGVVETLSSTLPPGTILENMRTTIRSYASTFGENPVGTNPEIARVLAGDNPKQIVFLKEDGNRLNARGELVDPWGTPYFFHQLSGTEMEIRSAGPDKKMWTADDLVIR